MFPSFFLLSIFLTFSVYCVPALLIVYETYGWRTQTQASAVRNPKGGQEVSHTARSVNPQGEREREKKKKLSNSISIFDTGRSGKSQESGNTFQLSAGWTWPLDTRKLGWPKHSGAILVDPWYVVKTLLYSSFFLSRTGWPSACGLFLGSEVNYTGVTFFNIVFPWNSGSWPVEPSSSINRSILSFLLFVRSKWQ